MSQNRIFREELPGEKKSIVNLLMTGYIVTISCLGYAAFYLYSQLGQFERIVKNMQPETQTAEQIGFLKNRITNSADRLKGEMVGLAIIGSLVSIIGGLYTINMVVRPLKKLIQYADSEGGTPLPEIKTNNEIKQLSAALERLTQSPTEPAPRP
jgi:nitrogen fixation/metabolism regulation signal transduction histidine kinase